MIKIKRNCKEIEEKKIGAKSESNGAKTGEKQGKNRGLRDFAASVKSALCCKTSSQPNCPLCENFRSYETNFGTRVPLRSTGAPIFAAANHQSMKSSISQGKLHLEGCFAAAKPTFGTRVPFRSTVTLISQL